MFPKNNLSDSFYSLEHEKSPGHLVMLEQEDMRIKLPNVFRKYPLCRMLGCQS